MWKEYRLHRTPELFEQVHLFRKNSTLLWECGKSTDFTVHQNYLSRYIYLEKIALFCGNVERVPTSPYTKIIWTGHLLRKNSTLLWECGKSTEYQANPLFECNNLMLYKVRIGLPSRISIYIETKIDLSFNSKHIFQEWWLWMIHLYLFHH